MQRILLLTICSLCLSLIAGAQKKPSDPKMPKTQKELGKEYLERLKKEKLFGVYIPKDIDEAIVELDKKTSPESRIKFQAAGEFEAIAKLHYSLGRWIRYNWGFHGGSRLTLFLNSKGAYHPDEMSWMVMLSYHRHLNKRERNLPEQLEMFKKLQEAKKKQEEAERN